MQETESELREQQKKIVDKIKEIQQAKAAGRIELQRLACKNFILMYPQGKRITKKRMAKIEQMVELIEQITYQTPHTVFLNTSTHNDDLVWNVVVQLEQGII